MAVPFLYGVPVVVMDHWDPVEALRLIERHGITHTHMVPTMFHRLLALPEETRTRYDTSSLRFVIHGAAPCPVPIKQRLIEWLGPVVVEYYAATEGLGTLVDSATWLAHPGTVGRPMVPGLVKVADDTGAELPPGEIGLVFLQAPAATKFDYYGDEEKTAGAFRGDYFTLGDMGYMDERGVPLPDRPHRQPHHLRRGQHLPGRGRRRAPGAPGGGRRGHHRRARRGVGRGGQGGGPTGRGGGRAATSWPTSSWRSAGTTWPTSSAPAASTSWPSSRGRILGRSSRESCESSTRRAAQDGIGPRVTKTKGAERGYL